MERIVLFTGGIETQEFFSPESGASFAAEIFPGIYRMPAGSTLPKGCWGSSQRAKR